MYFLPHFPTPRKYVFMYYLDSRVYIIIISILLEFCVILTRGVRSQRSNTNVETGGGGEGG